MCKSACAISYTCHGLCGCMYPRTCRHARVCVYTQACTQCTVSAFATEQQRVMKAGSHVQLTPTVHCSRANRIPTHGRRHDTVWWCFAEGARSGRRLPTPSHHTLRSTSGNRKQKRAASMAGACEVGDECATMWWQVHERSQFQPNFRGLSSTEGGCKAAEQLKQAYRQQTLEGCQRRRTLPDRGCPAQSVCWSIHRDRRPPSRGCLARPSTVTVGQLLAMRRPPLRGMPRPKQQGARALAGASPMAYHVSSEARCVRTARAGSRGPHSSRGVALRAEAGGRGSLFGVISCSRGVATICFPS